MQAILEICMKVCLYVFNRLSIVMEITYLTSCYINEFMIVYELDY